MTARVLLRALLVVLALPVIASATEPWRSLYDRAMQYQKARNRDSALICIGAALDSARSARGEIDSSTAMVLHRIGLLKNEESEDSSLVYWQKALAVWDKLPDANPLEKGKTLNNLAATYLRRNDFAPALAYALQSLELKRTVVGENDTALTIPLLNLGKIYLAMDSVGTAERMMLRSLDIRTRASGDTSLVLNNTYAVLSDLYMRTWRWTRAVPLLLKATQNSLRDADSLAYFGQLSNLARCYSEMRKVDLADSLFAKSLAYFSSTPSVDPNLVFPVLLNAGRHGRFSRQYDSAEKWLKEAQLLCETKLGNRATERYKIEYNLGLVERARGRYDEAAHLIGQSISTASSILGGDNLEIGNLRRALARTYILSGDNSAGQYTESVFREFQGHAIKDMVAMSETDALQFGSMLSAILGDLLSCYFNDPQSARPSPTQAATAVFSTKGITTDMVWQRRQRDEEQSDPYLRAVADSILGLRKELSRRYSGVIKSDSAGTRRKGLDSLGALIDRLDTDYALHSASIQVLRQSVDVTTQQISEKLPDGSVLLEYLCFSNYKSDLIPEEPHYAAIVLSKNGPVSVTDLGSAAAIDSVVDEYRRHLSQVSLAHRLPDDSQSQHYHQLSRKLYDLLVSPLTNDIGSNRFLIISPDAALCNVSFAGLEDESGKYLVETSIIQYLSAGRDILRLEGPLQHNSGLLAIGNPDFNAAPSVRLGALGKQSKITVAALTHKSSDAAKTAFVLRSACGDIGYLSVQALPETKTELAAVSKSWKQHTRESVTCLDGAAASEDRFKEEAPGKHVLHLATHGYFVGRDCSDSVAKRSVDDIGTSFESANPLLLSGLLFAGSNLHGAGADSAGLDDGYLSADEVMSLDLKGTALVVLSACESGLGEERHGEGLYGLKRSFQMAGAHSVVSALWRVSDQAAADIMGQLYNISDRSLAERLRDLQLAEIKKLRGAGLPDHPVSWAAFVVQGDWR